MELYPLKFDNIYIKKIWGGRDFSLMRNNLPDGNVGETMDMACDEFIMSTAINGPLKGMTLRNIVKQLGNCLLGDKVPGTELPIMLRMVNPRDKLSVQVHPTDKYAQSKGMKVGKTEAWYVVETFEDPFVYVGTQGCTEAEFKQSIVDGNVEKHMRRYDVKRGDMFLLRAGVVHAMGHDLIMAELGQNSNVTYRIFDYGRGRDVDVEDALQVVDLSMPSGRSHGVTIDYGGYSRTIYFYHEYFAWERLDIMTEYITESDPERFNAYMCVSGNGILHYGEGEKEYIKYGESVLIPAYMGKYRLQGEMSLLNAYVPDKEKSKREYLSLVELS